MTNSRHLETLFAPAVAHWWASKDRNSTAVERSQGGSRDANLRGDTMDGFRDVIRKHLIEVGVDPADIFSGNQFASLAATLPSFFRATKNWDIIVCKNSHFKRVRGSLFGSVPEPTLIAAVEFKSQLGSIGNNQNNRIEESIGNATDFWASYENKNFLHLHPRPWLGYLFIGRYGEGDIGNRVEINQPHFPADPAFDGDNLNDRLTKTKYKGPSYATRYKIFLERMIARQQYDRACFIVSNESIRDLAANYLCLFEELSGEVFVDGLLRHVKAYYFE
jgi:hypothetical protein